MNMHSDFVVIIPARINSTRLKNKPLQLIDNYSIIEHMILNLQGSIPNIYIATDSEIIANKVTHYDVKCIMTDPNCPSGSDRVYEAFQLISKTQQFNYIINIQGDMPFLSSASIFKVIEDLKKNIYGIVTPVVKVGIDLADSESNVKVVVDRHNKALYFSRSLIPYGAKEFLYHVGIYGFTSSALKQFITLPQSDLEIYENLEQLRAIANQIPIGVCYIDDIPISIDTPNDLKKAIAFNKIRSNQF